MSLTQVDQDLQTMLREMKKVSKKRKHKPKPKPIKKAAPRKKKAK